MEPPSIMKKVIKLGIGIMLADVFCKVTGLDKIISEALNNVIRVHKEEEAMSKLKYLLEERDELK